MELFLASANSDEMLDAYSLPITGVLTNSTILKKENTPLPALVEKVDAIGDLEFGLQIAATNEEDMLKEAKLFRSLLKNRKLHLKIPFCKDAFKLIRRVKDTGMVLNLTGISTLSQAVMALESDIDYLSIYVGRVTDAGQDGLALIADIKKYAVMNGKKTKILAASIRNLDHLNEVIKIGADAVAIPYALLLEMLDSEITLNSVTGFQRDWNDIQKE